MVPGALWPTSPPSLTGELQAPVNISPKERKITSEKDASHTQFGSPPVVLLHCGMNLWAVLPTEGTHHLKRPQPGPLSSKGDILPHFHSTRDVCLWAAQFYISVCPTQDRGNACDSVRSTILAPVSPPASLWPGDMMAAFQLSP